MKMHEIENEIRTICCLACNRSNNYSMDLLEVDTYTNRDYV